MKTCDLHTHTTASDGSDSPGQLVAKAQAAGLSAIAVTDHDTVSGLEEAGRAAKDRGIELVPGVELSVNFHKGNMHMLGYYMDVANRRFLEVLERVQGARARRNPKILALLDDLGLPISMKEVEALSKGGQIGRPHIARAMVEKGYVKSVSEAFDKYLKRGARAYAPKSILSPGEAIEVLRGAKGVPVLAHPFSLMTSSQEELDAIVFELKEAGLMGIECYYSEHDSAFTSMCLGLARRYNLVVTGGSDYHGKAKPHIRLGKGRGNLVIPYECVEALKAARAHV